AIKSGKSLQIAERQKLDGGKSVHALIFAGDDTLISGGEKGITLWDAADGKEKNTLEDHKGPVTALAATADGKSFASADHKKVIHWNLKETKKLHMPDTDGAATGLAYSPDDKLLAAASGEGMGSRVQILDTKTGKEGRKELKT